MAAISDYMEKAMLDWVLGGATPTRPTTRHASLHTSATDDSGGGTEVSTFGYSRQTITFDAAATPGGTADSASGISFTASGGNWGTILNMGIWDASTNGNLLWHGALTASRVVNDGDTLTFGAGAIVCTLA